MTRPRQGAAGGSARLPVSRRDRRPALAALALLLVVAGALGSALVVYRSGHRTDVLVAAHEIKPGEQVTSADFTVARVAAGSSTVVPASEKHAYIGSFATTDIPAGTLINHLMFKVGQILPADGEVVGVTLALDQRPATAIAAGDVVRAYFAPKSNGQGNTNAPPPGQVLVDAARVVSVQVNSAESTTVSLLVSKSDAQTLVTAAAIDSVALSELPDTTTPPIDYQTGS